MKAIRVHAYGGPEAMVYEDVPSPEPGPGQIRVRQTAVGVNFIDIYFRSGAYKAPSLPFVLGKEGAGEVAELGAGVTDFRVGERVAYAGATGTYAEEVAVDAKACVH
ncbi:MAG: alcohol dehydrogenase catalytic domain-containing protein, partial [Methylobacteriaceae bacterium]